MVKNDQWLKMEWHSIVSVIRRYHIYKEPASIRAVLCCEREVLILLILMVWP